MREGAREGEREYSPLYSGAMFGAGAGSTMMDFFRRAESRRVAAKRV